VVEPPPRLAWVNPLRCLAPCDYLPPELVRVDDLGARDEKGAHRLDALIEEPTRALLAAAGAAGHRLRIASAFRSYAEQAGVFRAIKEKGRAARPGHSEHQLGTAVDLRLPTQAAVDWLATHAADFGFALSYLEGKQRVTGYRPEPWHVRFVGRAVAEEIRRNGWTLEEYFRADPTRGESGSCADCARPASRAPCGRVSGAGSCRGTVLTWCYDGALASVDCASSGQTCGVGPSGQRDCL
jgi:D-alanyl-D-alanine carboxypeptidase